MNKYRASDFKVKLLNLETKTEEIINGDFTILYNSTKHLPGLAKHANKGSKYGLLKRNVDGTTAVLHVLTYDIIHCSVFRCITLDKARVKVDHHNSTISSLQSEIFTLINSVTVTELIPIQERNTNFTFPSRSSITGIMNRYFVSHEYITTIASTSSCTLR